MKIKLIIFLSFVVVFYSCNNKNQKNMSLKNKAIFLHHSTGKTIIRGGTSKYLYKLFKESDIKKWFKRYNNKNHTNYSFKEVDFPNKNPYGWKNYPFDYYNIWVKNAGKKSFLGEPTLEMLTKEYGLIIWKHCFPVSNIKEDIGKPDINSEEKRLENYKLQYIALKEKMHLFPDTKFLVWTGAVHIRNKITEKEALRMKEFVNWVNNEWNEENDNIYIWDFYKLETEGELFLKEEHAVSKDNSHPNANFSKRIVPLFAKKIVNVLDIN